MLTSLYQALVSHLAALEVPVYDADCIPQGQTFPYVTMHAEPGGRPDQPGQLTLTAWCCGESAHADRLLLGDRLLTLLPGQGTVVSFSGGKATLRMTGSHAVPLRSGEALGIQLTWELRCFQIG